MTDLHELAMKIRYDLTSAQGKLTDLVKAIDALNIEPRLTAPDTCESCFVGGGLHTDDCQALHLATYIEVSRARIALPGEATS